MRRSVVDFVCGVFARLPAAQNGHVRVVRDMCQVVSRPRFCSHIFGIGKRLHALLLSKLFCVVHTNDWIIQKGILFTELEVTCEIILFDAAAFGKTRTA